MAYTPIPNFPKYRAGKNGVILGQNGSPLSPRATKPSRKGNLPYLMVALYNENGRKDVAVHRLVLETFVGPQPEGQEARHKNGNPLDNRLVNLAWGTKEENSKDKIKHRPNCGRCGKKLSGRNLMMVSNGKRQVRSCRSCHNARTLAWHNAKRGNRMSASDDR